MGRSQFQVVVNNATVSSILSREVIHALDWRLSTWTKTSNEIQITTFPTLCGPSPPNVIWVYVDDEDNIEGDDNEADCDNGNGAEMACSSARVTLGPMNITQWHSTGQSTRQHSDLIKWSVFTTVVENFKLIKKWEERVVLCFFYCARSTLYWLLLKVGNMWRDKLSLSMNSFIITSLCIRFTLWARGERILFFGLNTNTNIIRSQNVDRIQIRIIFVFFRMSEYEYE